MPILFSLINLPLISDVIAGVGTTSAPLFEELYPIALYFVGFSVAGIIIYFIISSIISVFQFLNWRHKEFPDTWDFWKRK